MSAEQQVRDPFVAAIEAKIAAWKAVLERRSPAGIALTRQNIPVFTRGTGAAHGDELAAYCKAVTVGAAEGVAAAIIVLAV